MQAGKGTKYPDMANLRDQFRDNDRADKKAEEISGHDEACHDIAETQRFGARAQQNPCKPLPAMNRKIPKNRDHEESRAARIVSSIYQSSERGFGLFLQPQ